ncbi:MAG: hypothetical protein HY905_22640 [Deltaproteobacteria bacterium]|nr:hypothetical protein [Deltaproteobacteria bacterium]
MLTTPVARAGRAVCTSPPWVGRATVAVHSVAEVVDLVVRLLRDGRAS